jgi:hypothetical protein
LNELPRGSIAVFRARPSDPLREWPIAALRTGHRRPFVDISSRDSSSSKRLLMDVWRGGGVCAMVAHDERRPSPDAHGALVRVRSGSYYGRTEAMGPECGTRMQNR